MQIGFSFFRWPLGYRHIGRGYKQFTLGLIGLFWKSK